MQIFVRSDRTCVLHVSPADTVSAVKLRVQEAEGVPACCQRLLYSGRQLLDGATLADCDVQQEATLHLVLRLRGGKGGFGALLRGAGRGAQSDNQDAMRDLCGRRLRHTNADKKLKEWAAGARQREAEAAERKRLRELEKQAVREARKQVSLEDVHAAQAAALASVADAFQAGLASGKRAAPHAPAAKPPAAKRARAALPLDVDALSSGASDSEGDSEDGLTYPRPAAQARTKPEAGGGGGVPAAMRTFQPQRPVASGLSDSCVAVIAAPGAAGGASGSTSSSGSEQQALPARMAPAAGAGNAEAAMPSLEHQASNPAPRAVSTGQSAPGAALVEMQGSASEPRAFPPVDLEAYAGPAALEALGLEHLKAELARRGLKCGGALRERAARLWLLRHTPLERLDRKHLAKPANSAA